jgi:hypothetical protein
MPKISQADYIKFSKEYAKNYSTNTLRFGQAFCNKYNITDPKLFYETDPATSINYIWKHYIEVK